jgi:multisubunit Na+/H+ antiporter MnhB subunit
MVGQRPGREDVHLQAMRRGVEAMLGAYLCMVCIGKIWYAVFTQHLIFLLNYAPDLAFMNLTVPACSVVHPS